jgi:hypothetical protein
MFRLLLRLFFRELKESNEENCTSDATKTRNPVNGWFTGRHLVLEFSISFFKESKSFSILFKFGLDNTLFKTYFKKIRSVLQFSLKMLFQLSDD